MKHDQTFFFYPGGDPGGGNDQKPTPEVSETTEQKISPTGEGDEEHKTVGEKIKEALQDWSNKDQADQDFDDTRV